MSPRPVLVRSAHARTTRVTAANCTTSASLEPSPCALFILTPGAPQTVAVTAGRVACVAAVHAAPQSAPVQYAVLAKDVIMQFPGTPDALPLQVCALVHCPEARSSDGDTLSGTVADSPSGTVACAPRWSGPGVFDAATLTASLLPGVLLPMLADGMVRPACHFLTL